MAKEAWPFIYGLGGVTLLFFLLGSISGLTILSWLGLIALILIPLVALFFRDPDRKVPPDPDAVVSACDGKVLNVKEVFEDKFFHDTVTTVAVFMSVTDVHVNRVPYSGRIEEIDYREGQHTAAFQDKASDKNEHSFLFIKGEKTRVLVKQIAGVFARRIVIDVTPGQHVITGKRFGMIRFGSRVDLFFPSDVKVQVSAGDRVVAGETIIGKVL